MTTLDPQERKMFGLPPLTSEQLKQYGLPTDWNERHLQNRKTSAWNIAVSIVRLFIVAGLLALIVRIGVALAGDCPPGQRLICYYTNDGLQMVMQCYCVREANRRG